MEDHVIIVTGSAAGIGGAITAELARRGAHVLSVDLDAEPSRRWPGCTRMRRWSLRG